MTHAIIEVLGKQYHVSEGNMISCDFMKDKSPDDVLEFDIKGMFSDFRATGKVKAKVIKHYLDEKDIIFYKTQRGHDRHKRGFRAKYTMLKIESVSTGAKTKKASAVKSESNNNTEENA